MRHRRDGRGFTLVELLVVLAIIALLVALLIPAIAAAVRRANAAATQAEIQQLAQSLADFKSKFGDYPPSRVLLEESGTMPVSSSASVGSGATADVTAGQLAQRTMTAFRKFWPRMRLNTTATAGTSDIASQVWFDFNGDGLNPSATTSPNPYVIGGTECLVFFLAGVPNARGGAGVNGMTGWSKTPVNPFDSLSQNRTPPLYEFDPNRLIVTNATSKMPGYKDRLAGGDHSFYAYFSTNNGSGYDPNDVNMVEADTAGTTPIGLTYKTGFPVFTGTTQAAGTLSPAPNPYTTGPTYYTSVAKTSVVSNVSYINGQSFQIFSAGVDGQFGVGGAYLSSPSAGSSLVPEDTTTQPPPGVPMPVYPNSNSPDTGLRVMEKDNLGNWHNGTLE